LGWCCSWNRRWFFGESHISKNSKILVAAVLGIAVGFLRKSHLKKKQQNLSWYCTWNHRRFFEKSQIKKNSKISVGVILGIEVEFLEKVTLKKTATFEWVSYLELQSGF